MGTCLTSCLPHSETTRTIRNFNILDNEINGVDFTFLVEDNVSRDERTSRNFLSRFFKKRKTKKKPVLQLVESLISPQGNSYSRLSESQRSSTGLCTSHDIQLQCLDARALLQGTTTSTPASSLDLEWEHETLPISMVHDASGSSWAVLPDDLSCCPSTLAQNNTTPVANSDDWSRVSSSANSLEWDNVQSIHESSLLSEVDTDTHFLLCEIERLTNKTLEETGQDLFS